MHFGISIPACYYELRFNVFRSFFLCPFFGAVLSPTSPFIHFRNRVLFLIQVSGSPQSPNWLEKTFLRAFSSWNLHCGDAQVQLRFIVLWRDTLYCRPAFFEFALTLCATWFKSVFELYFVHTVKPFLPQQVKTAKTQSAQNSGTTTFVNRCENAVFEDLNEYFCCWKWDRQWNRSWRRCSHGPTSTKQHSDDDCKITVALWEAQSS